MTNHIQALLAKIKSRIDDLEIDARNARIDNWEDDHEQIQSQIETLWCLHSEVNLNKQGRLESLQSECKQEAKELGKYNDGARWNQRNGQAKAYEWIVDEIECTMDAIAEYHKLTTHCVFCNFKTNQYEIEMADEMLKEHEGGMEGMNACCHCANTLITEYQIALAEINESKAEFASQGC